MDVKTYGDLPRGVVAALIEYHESRRLARGEGSGLSGAEKVRAIEVLCARPYRMGGYATVMSDVGTLTEDMIGMRQLPPVPFDYPVAVLVTWQARQAARDLVTCGTCGRSWDDAVVTSMTPAPGARCPFEAFHY